MWDLFETTPSFRTQDQVNEGLKSSWEAKMKLKKERQGLLAKQQQLRDKRDAKRDKLKKILKKRRERKKLNEFKSSQYQVIKETKKIRKWSKQAR